MRVIVSFFPAGVNLYEGIAGNALVFEFRQGAAVVRGEPPADQERKSVSENVVEIHAGAAPAVDNGIIDKENGGRFVQLPRRKTPVLS